MGVFLEEKDEAKLQAMASSKTSGKSTYALRLQYFDEDEGSQNSMVLEARCY